MYRTAIRTMLLASVAAMSAVPAHAQDAAEAPSVAEQDEAASTIDTGEIVVTARRTEENLQRVPAAISAFSERTLERIQATDTTGLQGAVPNLNIVQGRGSSNATNIFIRGIGQPDALQTFDPAVGVYIDDVYLSRIRGNQLDLLDVERVEVLRGPQGTLYGKNTIGGAIKFVTRKPSQQFRATGSIAVGSYDQFDLKLAASGPVSDTIAAGFAVMRAKRDGFVEDRNDDREYNDRNTVAARGAIAFTPTSALRIDLTADYAHDDASLNTGAPLNALTYLFTPGVVVPLERDPDDYNYTVETTPGLPNSTKMTHWGFSGTAAYDVNDALTLKSITAYRKLSTTDYIDIDATAAEIGDVLVDVRQDQFSQEFQLTYTSDRLTAVGGLYYLDENVSSHQEAFADDLINITIFRGVFPDFLLGPSNFPTFLRTIDDDLKTDSYAAYVNGSFALTDALRISAGLRWTREEKDYFRTTSTFSSAPFLNSAAPFVFERKDRWKNLSPMLSVDYQFTPTTMAYLRYAKGFKSGGFNGRANEIGSATAYDPETTESYEAGLKTTIARQLRFNAAVFHNNYKDFQARVSELDESTVPPTPLLSVLNAGKLRIRGAELEAAWTPTPELLLDTQIGYLDAKYKQFDDLRFTNFDGSRAFQEPAFAPKWTMRFGAQYAASLGSAGTLTLGGQARYRSRHALSVDNTFTNSDAEIEGLFQKGYWLGDARVVWEDAAKHYSVGLYANNLFDKLYKTDGQEFSSIGSIRTVYFGAPRTFTLRLTARY
ncbi:TonB-dependent receptor [Sphingomonas xanthus]|uniref:TonB-dependent receptor n=1 Tax=Sphingomonas xanthus TaxID=2594473 RepID=A0A516IRR3_9SPHN|nr:TonB-dependent receptor [Sphingomonas xanthus]QDP19602.1 TonB-dependent receptor [Sphingomonas xanthus]